MQDYNTIIGAIQMRLNKCSTRSVMDRFRIGSSTLNLIMSRYKALELTIDELEAKAKNGEPVAIMDIIAANEAEKVKKGKTPSKNETSKKKPSIKKQLAEAKAQADKQPQKSEKVKNAALEV